MMGLMKAFKKNPVVDSPGVAGGVSSIGVASCSFQCFPCHLAIVP